MKKTIVFIVLAALAGSVSANGLLLQQNAYGPGIYKDQYGRAVTATPSYSAPSYSAPSAGCGFLCQLIMHKIQRADAMADQEKLNQAQESQWKQNEY